jgi:integrase
MAWVMWIGAYSGMRLDEICSLKLTDLKKGAGVWYFDRTNAKTEAGARRVPVHSVLLKAGLLTYAKRIKGDWLFPSLNRAAPTPS